MSAVVVYRRLGLAVNVMLFKPMHPDAVRKALEGQENVLAAAVQAHESYFKSLSCPSCGGDCMAFVDPSRLFREGSPIPNYLARCKTCGSEFEPYTKIVLTVPNPSKVTF
jgi:hypothetical protein